MDRITVEENLLADGCMNLAYSYIGPEVTQPIYRNGTIGKAKEDLENSAKGITELMQKHCRGKAFVSVNKAVVTQQALLFQWFLYMYPCYLKL